jgi:UDP-GlcNAc:undecaprenyl-phosphate GlcNAc-1-phosphate transferase
VVISGNKGYLSYQLILATVTLPYLIFNLSFLKVIAKNIYGLSVIWLLTIGKQSESASVWPVTALWIYAILLIDMLAIIIRRHRKGKSPFKPYHDYLHHILQRAGLFSRQTLVVILIASALMSLLGVIGENFQVLESTELALFVLMFILYNKYVRRFSCKYDELTYLL